MTEPVRETPQMGPQMRPQKPSEEPLREPAGEPSSESSRESSERRPLFFLSAGDASGDIHAARLVTELRQRFPNARFVSYGGPEMEKAGCEQRVELTAFAFMWIGHVLLHLFTFLGYLKEAKRFFETERPDLVILVDFPGFNWLLAKRAKKAGIPVCYFLPPQVWGWGQWRVKKMRRFVDFVLCTLPFEEKWLRGKQVRAVNVGHPFFEEVRNRTLDRDFLDRFAADGRDASGAMRPTLLLLPGSRNQEVSGHFADLFDAVRQVREKVPNVRPVVAAFKESQAETMRETLRKADFSMEVFVGRTPELMSACTVALSVSGSVSMELLARTIPTVIYYRFSRLAFWIKPLFCRVKSITLVNLLALDAEPGESPFYDDRLRITPRTPTARDQEKMLFPEIQTDRNRGLDAVAPLTEWLTEPAKFADAKARLAHLLEREDGHENPTREAAEWIQKYFLTSRGTDSEV